MSVPKFSEPPSYVNENSTHENLLEKSLNKPELLLSTLHYYLSKKKEINFPCNKRDESPVSSSDRNTGQIDKAICSSQHLNGTSLLHLKVHFTCM